MVARFLRLLSLALMLGAVLPCASRASGILCGTIRDALTAQPVARAGIFVRTQAGAYTGYHAASDAAGHFCIGGIPAGTYDLEVRVDDYQVAYRRGVVVNDETTGIDIDATLLASALFPPWPNPSRTGVHLRFRNRDAAPLVLSIVDTQGRMVKGWSAHAARQVERDVFWDFRDRDGNAVPAGRYFVRLSAGGAAIVQSFVRLP